MIFRNTQTPTGGDAQGWVDQSPPVADSAGRSPQPVSGSLSPRPPQGTGAEPRLGTRSARQRRFARYLAIPDGIGTSAVLDRTTDRVIADRLPRADAEQLARDWNRHEPPEVER